MFTKLSEPQQRQEETQCEHTSGLQEMNKEAHGKIGNGVLSKARPHKLIL